MKEIVEGLKQFRSALNEAIEQAGNCEKCRKPKSGFVSDRIWRLFKGDQLRIRKHLGLCTCDFESIEVSKDDRSQNHP